MHGKRWGSPLWCAPWLVALAGLFLHPASAQPSAPAAAPQLRIETGAHTAPIRALSVDAAARYAVTAGEDKTARVWDLASGALVQVLRPPSGAGGEGKLYAAAISADGRFVAAGGWSAQNDVYLFQRGSGQLVHRITGLPNVVTHLAFTPDGRRLVVNLWGRNGIRLYASDDGWASSREAGSDADYGGESYGADISADGTRLVTSAFDGSLRLYALGRAGEPALRLLKRARVDGAAQPFGVALAPDGKRVAVGFADRPVVAVLDAADLSSLFMPSVQGIANGSLSAVAWSPDGRQLLAAGAWKRAEGQHALRRWSDGGRGTASDSVIAGNSVVDLRVLADGRLVFAATDPAWGVLAPSGNRLVASGAGIADFRGDRALFRLAQGGQSVAFTMAYGAQAPAAFDLDAMDWADPARPAAAPLQASPLAARGLVLQDWFEQARPQLNGRAIALEPNETALAAAVGHDGATLALGTSFQLRYLQRDGRELWSVPAPGTTWQVAQSQDGRWVVAAFSDGSLRWYRASDGAEQLALLPHADRRRWVAWTPQGYYAASPGGEDLIGWQVDRGPLRAADFFAGSRFRAGFFRPDVIAQVIAAGDAAAALQAANDAAGRKAEAARIDRQLPPVVSLLSPADGVSTATPQVRIEVTVRAQVDAPATSLRVRVNGRAVAVPGAEALPRPSSGASSSSGAAESRHVLTVPLSPEDAEIMVFAENRHGFSTPAVLRVKWAAAPAPAPVAAAPPPGAAPAGTPDARPVLYVLAVGVSKYRDASLRLGFPSKDAGDFANIFRNQQDGLYRKVVVKLLTDEGARRDDVLDGLEWIRREMTARDVGVVFLAGHGVNDSDGVYYYLPQDVDTDRLKRSGVIFTEIRNTLAALPGKVMFFVDTCHAGNVLGTGRRGVRNDITAVVNELSSAENGVIVFAASTGRQEAQESRDWGNGAFTKAVVEGVGGKADAARTGRVTHKMLDLYISERVKGLTKGAQSPVTIVPQGVPDFPLVLSR